MQTWLGTREHEILHRHHAEEMSLCVERGSAGKTCHRYRLTQFNRIAFGKPRLDLGELLGAVLLFRIRDAD